MAYGRPGVIGGSLPDNELAKLAVFTWRARAIRWDRLVTAS